jgi:hypothetical protein
MWCLTEGLTVCAASLLAGFDGRALWNLEEEKLYSKDSENLFATAKVHVPRGSTTPPIRTAGVGMALRACDSGLEITEILSNGPVQHAGQVRVGDILKKVDGKIVGETVSSAKELLIGPEGTTVTLNVLRHAPFGMFGMPDAISVSVVRGCATSHDSREDKAAAATKKKKSAEVCAAWDAVLKLRKKYNARDMLLATNAMAEEHPLIAVPLATEAHLALHDYSYSLTVYDFEVTQQERKYADAELAARLQKEWLNEGISVCRAQEEEQMRMDYELARLIENEHSENRLQAIILANGRDVRTFPPVNLQAQDGSLLVCGEESITPPRTGNEGECVACLMTCTDAIKLPCGHFYCSKDLRALFQVAIKDTSLLPVSCCKIEVPSKEILEVLNKDELSLVCERVREKRAQNKMYCANPTCSLFMDLDQLSLFRGIESNVLDCTSCGLQHCIRCKSFSHGVRECIAGGGDDGSVVLVELATREGWKKCNKVETCISFSFIFDTLLCI